MAFSLFAEHNKTAWIGIRPAVVGEPVSVDGLQSGAGTVVLYTVPAGKTLLLFNDWAITEASSAAGLDHTLGVYNAVPALTYRLFHFVNLGATFSVSKAHARFVPLEIPEGFSIRIVVVAAAGMLAGIEGLLIDPLTEL